MASAERAPARPRFLREAEFSPWAIYASVVSLELKLSLFRPLPSAPPPPKFWVLRELGMLGGLVCLGLKDLCGATSGR